MFIRCKFSSESRKINKTWYFSLSLISSIFRNNCNLITVKSYSVTWISDDIDCVRIFADSSTSTNHLFNLIKNFLSQIYLIYLWIISNSPDSVIAKFFFEKVFIFLYIIVRLINTFVFIRVQLIIILQSYMETLTYVSVLNTLLLISGCRLTCWFHFTLVTN